MTAGETPEEIYKRVEKARQENYPDTPFQSLEVIAKTVINNAPEGTTDYEELLRNVLYAMEYMNSNTVEGMIERAEADYPRRYEEMTPEQQQACDDYRLDYNQQTADLNAKMNAEINRLWEME